MVGITICNSQCIFAISLMDSEPSWFQPIMSVFKRNSCYQETYQQLKGATGKIPFTCIFHSLEKEWSWRKGAYLFSCMCFLSLTSEAMLFGHVFNIIVFVFHSKSKLAWKLLIHWKCITPATSPLRSKPSWFWILYWKLGELLQTWVI